VPVLKLSSTDTKVTSDFDKAQLLNETFTGHYVVDNGIIPPLAKQPAIKCTMTDVVFYLTGVLRCLVKLNSKSAVGPDDIPNILL